MDIKLHRTRIGPRLYQQICKQFRQTIADGSCRPGVRVPSIRDLADQLQISRGTVEIAYGILISEGYLVARGRLGTIVSPCVSPQQVSDALAENEESEVGDERRAYDATRAGNGSDIGLPARDLFPYKLWMKLLGKHLRQHATLLSQQSPVGYIPLRAAIAGHLSIFRGVSCHAEQIFIVPGYRCAINLVAHVLLGTGDSVLYEDPSLRFPKLLLAKHGIAAIPIPVDDQGMRLSAGNNLDPGARLAIVSPTRQSVFGTPMSVSRRRELATWAERSGAYVLEDGYSNEFAQGDRPSSASPNPGARTLYMGSFAKSISPITHLTYLAITPDLVDRFNEACSTFYDSTPIVDQSVIASFISEGHYTRHLKKIRQIYVGRHRMLAEAMDSVFGTRFKTSDNISNLSLLATIDESENDQEMAGKARSRGFPVTAISSLYSDQAVEKRKGLMIEFSAISSRERAFFDCRALEQAMDGVD
jgi:GntR family transcriptional regulator/MocR family aminotransferase